MTTQAKMTPIEATPRARATSPRWLALALTSLVVGCATSPEPRDPSMPLRVLILGDSISIGYTGVVRELLGEQATVTRPTLDDGVRAENCAGTTRGLKHIERWLAIDGGGFDVVHFNFGLHDLKRMKPGTDNASNDPSDPRQAELELYVAQLREIATQLQASDAQLIFATTTPVPEGGVKPHRDPVDVQRYNEAAVALMEEFGIEVNDLYGFVEPRLFELQRPVNVHFTSEGSRALGEEVAKAIRCAAE